jgi:predicted RNase H-like HicB family nuclease
MPADEGTEDLADPTFTMTFKVQLTADVTREGVGGFSARVMDLPGCVTEAETLEELRRNLREAAEGWIAVHGQQLQEWVKAAAVDDRGQNPTTPVRRVIRPKDQVK